MCIKHTGYYVYVDDDEFIVHIEVEGEPQIAYTHQTIKDPENATYGTHEFEVLKIEDNQGQEIPSLFIKKCNRMEEYYAHGLKEKDMPINMERGSTHTLTRCKLNYYISYERAQHYLYGCSSSSYVGIVRKWYPSGKLKQEGFVNGGGTQQGVEKVYAEFGDYAESETSYLYYDGEQHAMEKEYDDQGNILRCIPYVDGQLHGIELKYDRYGKVIEEIVWDMWEPIKIIDHKENLTDDDSCDDENDDNDDE